MRHKDLGIWQTWTWAQVLDEVRAFSVGLAELGLKRGDKFADHRLQPAAALLGDVRRRRRSAPCRCRSMPTRSPTRWPMCSSTPRSTHRGRRGPGAGRQAPLDRRPAAAALRHIIYDEPRGLRDYDHAPAASWIDDVQTLGREKLAATRRGCARWEAASRGRARAAISPSSSTPRARPAGRRA